MGRVSPAALIVAVVCAVLGVAAFFNPGFRGTSPVVALPELERVEQVGGGVLYVDRRGPTVLFYRDPDKDGEVDRVESRDHGQSVDSAPLAVFQIAETEYAAHQRNVRNFRDKELRGTYWLSRSSGEAMDLQHHYKGARAEYLKRHPGVILPENADPATRIRPESLERFQKFLAEYRAQDSRVHRARTVKASEVAQYREYLAFLELEEAYRELNEWERRVLFRTIADLPRGIKLDAGPEVTELLGIPLAGGDARGDFEGFLNLSYMEIDYMSAWSIFHTGEAERITKQYFEELRAKGLKGRS